MRGSVRCVKRKETKRNEPKTWEISIDLGRDGTTGKRPRHFETFKGRKTEAQKRLAELLVSLEQGIYVKPSRLTVAQFLEEWLRDYVATNTAPRTAERYEQIVRTRLIPALGSLPLLGLRPHHIQKFYSQDLESGRRDGKGGLSALTVHHHHRVLYEALRHGVKHGILIRNVAEAVDAPRPEHKKPAILTASDVQLILDACKETAYYVPFFTLAYTGLRRSELLGLRWGDVDLEKSTLSVVQALHQLRGGKYILREPKTKLSRRQIALSPSLAIVLWEHQLKQKDARKLLGKPLEPGDLVFSHPDGRPIRPDSVTRAFHEIAASVGLRGVRLHDLRHAHATILLQQRVNPKIVQERLGHSSVSTTLNIYSHVLPGLQDAAARQFDEAFEHEVHRENVGFLSVFLPQEGFPRPIS